MNLEELREYCLSLPHATEDMPFDEDILVFRICNRIFALTSLETRPLFVSLKCDPERAVELREQYPDKIVAGYHLNKKHWNTVSLEDLPHPLIKEMIQHSYDQVLAKVPKRERESLKIH
ncbi:MmcQ/YjbR family DNA-binding protein [Capnocytophaga leadbetteri]|uniref:MmcQ/YjbR family DNA-binding protein n=1 Tax=Capnocytophaga leadbetteri TaxID=327575 RepID=UPI0028EB2EF2|nr:MmcQ/YjbR family DNA-binding protein [Capnocytophaga leadbetteri]